jgi:hypothetical protein
MKRQATYSRHIRQIGPVMAAVAFATRVASAPPPGSGTLALRMGLMFGAVGALGLSAPPATGQGELTDFSTQNDAQRPMAQAIERVCGALN